MVNHMKEVANLLGVEEYEEFQIKGVKLSEEVKFYITDIDPAEDIKFRITEKQGLETCMLGYWGKHGWEDNLFMGLIFGYREVIKLEGK